MSKVNGIELRSRAARVPPASEALSTGSDRSVLVTPGRKWYISGVDGQLQSLKYLTSQLSRMRIED